MTEWKPMNLSRFTEQEKAVIEAVLEQDITGKKNAQLADEMGISLATFYRIKRRPEVTEEILKVTKQKADLLLPLAVEKTRRLLESDELSGTATVALLKLIYQQAGLTKPEEKPQKATDNSKSLDELMASYGIKSAHKQSV